jgi:hypothetical protein
VREKRESFHATDEISLLVCLPARMRPNLGVAKLEMRAGNPAARRFQL